MAALPPLSFETQILEMMQRSKHVRRPFSGRSSVLVFTWSHVATNSSILRERGIARRHALRKCVNGMRLRVLLFNSSCFKYRTLSLSLEIFKYATEQLTSSQRFEDAAEVKAVGEKFESVFRDLYKIYEHYKARRFSVIITPLC